MYSITPPNVAFIFIEKDTYVYMYSIIQYQATKEEKCKLKVEYPNWYFHLGRERYINTHMHNKVQYEDANPNSKHPTCYQCSKD